MCFEHPCFQSRLPNTPALKPYAGLAAFLVAYDNERKPQTAEMRKATVKLRKTAAKPRKAAAKPWQKVRKKELSKKSDNSVNPYKYRILFDSC